MSEERCPSAATPESLAHPAPLAACLRRHLPFVLLLAYFGVVFDTFLFRTAGLTCPDGFFYARYAYLLPDRGLDRTFPWLYCTSLRDAFWDNKFLYHVFLMPFCRLAAEPLVGAKAATLCLQLVVLVVCYVALIRLKTPWPLAWVALLVVGNGLFLNRLLMVRPHVLSMALMVLALYGIVRQHAWGCFAIAFVYAWSYSAPFVVLATAVAAELGRVAFLGRPSRLPRVPLAVAAGLLAGHLVHPYSPLTLQALWAALNVTATAAAGGSVELGTEYLPLPLRELFVIMPLLAIVLLAAVAGAVLLRRGKLAGRQLSLEAALALGAALAWFGAMFVFSRAAEYSAPLAVLAAALVCRDLAGGIPAPLSTLAPPARTRRLLAVAAVVLLLAASHEWSFRLVRAVARASRSQYPSEEAWRRGRHFDGAAAWMKQNLKPRTLVLNFHWDDFPELFYSAPEYYYVSGSDPTLLRLFRPDLSTLLEDMRVKKAPLDLGKLGAAFQAEYIIMRSYRAAEYPRLRASRLKPVFADEGAVIYQVPSGG